MLKLVGQRATTRSIRSTASIKSFIRSQSSTKNTNVNQLLNKSQLKVTRKENKSEFNSLSNENIVAQREVEKKTTVSEVETTVAGAKNVPNNIRIKKDYTTLPKVPSTNYLDPESIRVDALYAGFRPLAMDQLKPHLLPNKKWYAQSKFVDSIWSVSAAGLEEFDGWDRFDVEYADALKPYSAPKDTNVVKRYYKDGKLVNLEAAVDEVIQRVNRILPEPPQKKLTLRKGRARPRALKLAKKLKNK